MKTLTRVNKTEILEIAEQMTANHFLLEFGELLTIHDTDNLLDANDGMVNVSIEVKDGRKNETIYLLFIDGKFDSYSY
jgi:hypothetical protein